MGATYLSPDGWAWGFVKNGVNISNSTNLWVLIKK